ncbi:hypothetical protein Hdeb2414_s0013g00402961 [Helianthus debilis subsp. tardiflorus]
MNSNLVSLSIQISKILLYTFKILKIKSAFKVFKCPFSFDSQHLHR